MNQKNIIKVLPAVVGVALAVTPALAQTAPAKPAPAKAPASAGLVNDWLRKQDDAFKAFDIGAETRLRYEMFQNGLSTDSSAAGVSRHFIDGIDNDDAVLYFRQKVHLGYKAADWLGFYVQGRYSATGGDDQAANPGEDFVDVFQAYVDLGNKKEFPLTARIGRQVLSYGDQRYVGQSNWSNVDRSFDAFKLRYEAKDIWVDAFMSRVVLTDDNEFNVSNDYDLFSGVYAGTKTLIPKQETEVYFLSRNASVGSPTATTGAPTAGGPSARDIYSLGFRVKSLPGEFKGWDYSAEFIQQFGSVNVGGAQGRIKQDAFAASLGGGYTFKEVFAEPRVGFLYNYSSGDNNPTDGKSETLETLFGTNHGLYGLMDFTGLRNTHNPTLSLNLKPAKAWKVSLDYHMFWLANDRDFFYPQSGGGRAANGYGRNTQYSKFIGSEINLTAAYTIKPWWNLEFGYGHFFAGSYIKDSLSAAGNRAADSDWGYVQTVFKF
ncbi:MAG TPA: alginate export family protein [Verrucomicrobiae bacterium]